MVDAEFFHERLGLIFALFGSVVLGFHHSEDVLADGEFAEDGFFLGEVAHAEAGADVHGFGSGFVAVEDDAAGIGTDEADDHVEGGGFAGTVGAEEADDFALFDLDVDAIDDGATIVDFFETFGVEKAFVVRGSHGFDSGRPFWSFPGGC